MLSSKRRYAQCAILHLCGFPHTNFMIHWKKKKKRKPTLVPYVFSKQTIFCSICNKKKVEMLSNEETKIFNSVLEYWSWEMKIWKLNCFERFIEKSIVLNALLKNPLHCLESKNVWVFGTLQFTEHFLNASYTILRF